MFSDHFLRSFRVLLVPFSLLYWLLIGIRNWLYDRNIIKSVSFGIPLICVGNLSVGGTGKSPMVEFIIDHLRKNFRVATLSRGYKRKTKGYALAGPNTTALEIGDEPMQFHVKFPDVPVAVGEQRIEAVPQLLHDRPDTQAIILDDAFQHRAINAGFNIILTEFGNLFTRDFYLPAGDLRDLRKSYKRADVIVVTKCRPDLDEKTRDKLIKEINPLPHQSVFFTAIEYGRLYHLFSHEPYLLGQDTEVMLITGIANPKPLQVLLETHTNSYHMEEYPDHHIYTIDEIKDTVRKFEKLENTNKILLTTEKDAVRLLKFRHEISSLPIYVIPVRHHFLFGQEDQFVSLITLFITNFKQQI